MKISCLNISLLLILSGLLLSSFMIYHRKDDLLHVKVEKDKVKRVRTIEEWEIKRGQILAGMQEAMGKLPVKPATDNFDLLVTGSLKRENYTRLTIHFNVADNESVHAYLYLPSGAGSGKKYPAVLALHGTGSEGKRYVDGEIPGKDYAYAKELAGRGYVVIAPDYPGMGEAKDYDFDTDRYESGTMKGIFNHIRCVDFLKSLDYVDPERIGVIGHSLGGHNAIFAAAFDKRLKVVVSSCGWTLMDYYDIGEIAHTKYGGRLGPWAQEKYMPLLRTKFRLEPGKIPFDFDEIIASIAPRAFFSSSPDGDSNFDIKGVIKAASNIVKVYNLLNVEDNFKVIHPDAKHGFPLEAREEAYRFMDRFLKE